MIGVRLQNVNVCYPVFSSERQRSIVGSVRGAARASEVHALQDISFELKPGERLGLIGHNGAGKTTLLKVLGGMVPPTSGTITTNGDVLCLLNIFAGFDQEKNGYDNARFVAKLMGLSSKESKELVEDVEDFSGLGHFMSLPIRTYSAGMGMRLAFGVYTALPHDILIIDEIIGAGDARFHEKARERVRRAIDRAKILVIATHDQGTLQTFCTRGIWMSGGQMICDGPPDQCWQLYAA
jgi:ABC-type polysaccharide/polyol phosphate transport system ATPase subunit